jgi:hypothetical protein
VKRIARGLSTARDVQGAGFRLALSLHYFGTGGKVGEGPPPPGHVGSGAKAPLTASISARVTSLIVSFDRLIESSGVYRPSFIFLILLSASSHFARG